uniref:Uncharacterized protein n=1 Tax=Knipowitschia caucasica TaxID=637954 RepID=A0AAV2MAH2_KNICA
MLAAAMAYSRREDEENGVRFMRGLDKGAERASITPCPRNHYREQAAVHTTHPTPRPQGSGVSAGPMDYSTQTPPLTLALSSRPTFAASWVLEWHPFDFK